MALLTRAKVVVLDWMMPDGGGAAAARLIRVRSPDTAIVVVTSSTKRDAMSEMRRAGAFDVLVKGGSADALARTIHLASRLA